jgi:adenine deaminase
MGNWEKNETTLDADRLTGLIKAAGGKLPVDLLVRRCRLVNVLSGRIELIDLAVHDGFVVGWGDYEAIHSMDADGMYLCPGFIDGHIHIESTLLSPAGFCAAVLPGGTSAVVADPHEIANVLGLDGIRYFLEATGNIPLDVYFNLPSCVPASPLETSGARLGAEDLRSLLPHPRILGLAEMMNFPGVIEAFPDVVDKLLLFQDRVLDGHAPLLSGHGLNAYLATGISSDHECTSGSEAEEKLAKGMYLMLREGSQSKDLAHLLPAVTDHTWPRCMLVCDDKHPDDLLREGHMNSVVNRAAALGMDPIRAITLATWTPARYFGLKRRGAVAPGYKADFSLSPTLSPWEPVGVFKDGIEVARDGELLVDPDSWRHPPFPPSPMAIGRLSVEDLAVPAETGRLRVIGAREGTLLTRKILVDPEIMNGRVVADARRDILKLVVFNRYLPERRPSVAFVHGIGLKEGAMATTVAHDSHNLIAVGRNDTDILRVVEAVRKTRGGIAVGGEGGPIEVLPLPIGGLMSDQPLKDVVENLDRLKLLARNLGSTLRNPFMALSFLALPVIPELKVTDLGLVDVSTFSLVPLFESA